MGTLENFDKIHFFSCTPLCVPFLIYAVYPHFSQIWFLLSSCNSSMGLFKLLTTPAPAKAFVLSDLKRHINDYHENVYVKRVDKQIHKGFT